MSVRVVARIRPLLEKELDKDVIVRADRVEDGKPLTMVKIPNPKNEVEEFSFAFNGVYDQATTQEELFTSEGMQPRGVAIKTRLTASSGPPYQGAFPRLGCDNLCLWCHRHWQDTHDARRSAVSRTRCHPEVAEQRFSQGQEAHEGHQRGNEG